MNGQDTVRSGPTTESYGPKTETRYLGSMLGLELLTRVLPAVGNAHWLVRMDDPSSYYVPLKSLDLGVLSDATKSVSRAYINNFQDKSKQTAIDMFLVRQASGQAKTHRVLTCVLYADELLGKLDKSEACHSL
jgi:hypothetical protein